MSSQPNRLRPMTTALAMLRRGWTFFTPDGRFKIVPNVSKGWMVVFILPDHQRTLDDYPLTPDGFEAMMNEVVNPPF